MIDSSKLKYKKFKDPRHETVKGFTEGFSGQLLLATGSDGKKYIVKHEEMMDAGNEFVALFIGNKMGLAVPEAHILSPDKRLRSPYAVAIEYLEDLKLLGPYKELSIIDKRVVCAQFALSFMLDNSDIVQLRRRHDRIVQLDFADAFEMNGMFLNMFYATGHVDEAKKMIDNYSTAFARHLDELDFGISILSKELDMELADVSDVMLKIAKKVLEITEEDIDYVRKELLNIYPEEIAEHYINSIRLLQEKVASM